MYSTSSKQHLKKRPRAQTRSPASLLLSHSFLPLTPFTPIPPPPLPSSLLPCSPAPLSPLPSPPSHRLGLNAECTQLFFRTPFSEG